MIKRIRLMLEALGRICLENNENRRGEIIKNIKKSFTENILISDPNFYRKLKENRKKGFSKNISKFFIIAELIDNKMSYEDLKWAYKNVLGIKKKGRLDQHLMELIKEGLITIEDCAWCEKNITQCSFQLPRQDFEYFKTILDKLVYNPLSLKEFKELILSQLIFKGELYEDLEKYIEEKFLKTGKKKRKIIEKNYYSQVNWLGKLIFLYICKKLYDVGAIKFEKVKVEHFPLTKSDFTFVGREFLKSKKFFEKIIRKSKISKRLKHKFKAFVELMEELEKLLNKLNRKEELEFFLGYWTLLLKIYALGFWTLLLKIYASTLSSFWEDPLFQPSQLFYIMDEWYFRDEKNRKPFFS